MLCVREAMGAPFREAVTDLEFLSRAMGEPGARRLRSKETSMSVLRVISSVAAALTALSLFLLGLPGDSMPIEVVYGVGAASVFMSALAANLAVDEP